MFLSPDIAKLLLRLSVGIMMLFHGFHKIIHGIDGIKALVRNSGMPEFFAYGVYVGEVIVPIFIVLGLYARVASLVLAFNMFVAIALMYSDSLFKLGKFGSPVIELPFFYFILSVVIFFLGSGKFAINNK